MDYPELAAHIPADPLIVELPELLSNRFLIWVCPLMDLKTIFYSIIPPLQPQQSFFSHGITIEADTRKRSDTNGVSDIAEDEQSELSLQ